MAGAYIVVNNESYVDWRQLLFLAVFVALLSVGVLAGNGNHEFDWILVFTSEDRWLEVLQALGYFSAFFLCLIGVFTSAKRIFFCIWLVLTLLFLGEEINWGQRIFDFEVEFVERNNIGNEFNIHNLKLFNSGDFEAGKGVKNHVNSLFDIQFVFQMCFFLYFCFLPTVAFVSQRFENIMSRTQYIGPSIGLAAVSTALFVLSYIAVALVSGESYKNALIEIRETVFSLVIASYLFGVLVRYDKSYRFGGRA